MEIDDIPADKSGRSFFIKTSDGIVSYFWCSEKSKLLGTELRRKLKDLLTKKPSLADLTGIRDSRLNCFATHFRTYLAGSIITNPQISDDLSSTSVHPIVPSEIDFPQLGPGTYSLEESRRKSVSREKLRSISENYDVSVTSFNPSCQEGELQEADGTTHSMALLNFLDIGASELPEIQASSSGPLPSPFSPHYCWCPPVASPMQSTIGNPHLLPASTESSLPTLLPLSVLLADIPPIDFPTLPTEPLVQQIPTFTPLICDPIVHIPVIDICSSGQGYLVSGGHSVVVAEPLLPKTGESVVEKSARETLRMLISTQSNPLLLSKDEGNVIVGGSRGLYQDMDGGMPSMEAVLSLPNVKRCVWRENLKDKKEEGSE